MTSPSGLAPTWRVVDALGHTVPSETGYLRPRAAFYAATILNAHELNNGRAAGYRVDPPCDPIPLASLDLPRWVTEAFAAHAASAAFSGKTVRASEFAPKMMPGQEPYTSAETAKLQSMTAAACEAEEVFSADELEAYADTQRGK